LQTTRWYGRPLKQRFLQEKLHPYPHRHLCSRCPG